MMEPTPKTPSSKRKLLNSKSHNHLCPNSQLHHPFTTAATSMYGGENTPFNFNLNEDDDHHHQQLDDEGETNKEPLFEKPLTPSDVGKLNRLVIPKQYAEKHFPLRGGVSGGENGSLLSFEDDSGKQWRFRYSYWNSSQSYVLTKGWSRFVKEKRLEAGDVVLFERHRVDADRLFIGWRRRAAALVQDDEVAQPAYVASSSGGGGWTRMFSIAHPYPSHHHGPPLPYQPDHCLDAGSIMENETMPRGNSKTVRLFGVNLECQPDESDPPTPDGSSMSSQGHVSDHHNHMDIEFSRDVNQMRYRPG